jgi:hypothetical protein
MVTLPTKGMCHLRVVVDGCCHIVAEPEGCVMPFLNDLVVRQVGAVSWQLVEPLVYQGNRELFTVPAGFRTDFASVPRAYQWLIARSGQYTKAAVFHDWLVRCRPEIPRSDTDALFRRALFELGVPFVRRWLIWGAVRWSSLLRSGFTDGPEDLPQLLLITLTAGLPVIVGGLIVRLLLLGFYVVEVITLAILWPLRRIGWIREHTKELNRPTVLWTDISTQPRLK